MPVSGIGPIAPPFHSPSFHDPAPPPTASVETPGAKDQQYQNQLNGLVVSLKENIDLKHHPVKLLDDSQKELLKSLVKFNHEHFMPGHFKSPVEQTLSDIFGRIGNVYDNQKDATAALKALNHLTSQMTGLGQHYDAEFEHLPSPPPPIPSPDIINPLSPANPSTSAPGLPGPDDAPSPGGHSDPRTGIPSEMTGMPP